LPSSPPPEPTVVEPTDPERQYRLVRLIMAERTGFHFLLVLHTGEQRRDEMLGRLTADLDARGVDHLVLDLATLPDTVILLKALMDLLAANPAAPGRRRAVSVIGVERHLSWTQGGSRREATQLLADANFQRDAYTSRCPVPLALWATPLAYPTLAMRAPDLWHWRVGVFDLGGTADLPRSHLLNQEIPRPAHDWQWQPKEQEEKRLALIDAVLAEDDARLDDSAAGKARRARLLLEQGDILYNLGELDRAWVALRQALALFSQAGADRERAVTWGRIADILYDRGELDEALRIRREEQLPVYDRLGDVRERAITWGKIADILYRRGALDEALRIRREGELPVYDRLGDERSRAITWGQIADILHTRGELDEALRIRREEQLPVYDRLGDVRERAITWGRIADILHDRGELDEALRIRREEELPVYDRLGDEHSRAATWGRIADILYDRGELDEALRIRQEEVLPVFDRLGDVRERAITWGRIADILYTRGELDKALRIRREEELPVFDRLGDVRSRAVTWGRIADILYTRGELDEALRIRREEELPVYDRLGDVRSRAVTLSKLALGLLSAENPAAVDKAAALDMLRTAFTLARQGGFADVMGIAGLWLANELVTGGDLAGAAAILDQAEPALKRLGRHDLVQAAAILDDALRRVIAQTSGRPPDGTA